MTSSLKFNTAIMMSLVVINTKTCSIEDDCGVYTFYDWTGRTFNLDTKEICTSCDLFGTCWTSTCASSNGIGIFETAKNNLINNFGWDINKCTENADGCSVPQDLGGYPEYEAIFNDVCFIHDWCYSNSDLTATECDGLFMDNMFEKCHMEFPEGDTLAELTWCLSQGVIWASAVLIGGNSHHKWSAENDCITYPTPQPTPKPLDIPCAGGINFIQIGNFRIGTSNDNYWIIAASQNEKTNVVFNGNSDTIKYSITNNNLLNDRKLLLEPQNVGITGHGIQFGDSWCIGQGSGSFSKYLSIAFKSDSVHKVLQFFDSNGNAPQNPPGNSVSCWNSQENNVKIQIDKNKRQYIQFGNVFRIGDIGANQNGQYRLSVVSKQVNIVYRDDGFVASGPFNVVSLAPDSTLAPF
eukprot:376833_1